jgi:hypothetical protein
MQHDPFEIKMTKARAMMAEKLGVPPLPPEWYLRETTPPLDDRARRFFQAVGISDPVPVKVTPAEGAEPGWCIRNAERHAAIHGGSVLLGWVTWGIPGTMFESEFHAVVEDADGNLVDPTPQRDGEDEILFSPQRDLPPTFSFVNDRPGNKRRKSYRTRDLDETVAAKLASMNDASRRYASERAAAKGVTLEQWIESRIEGDVFDRAIDQFIALGDKMDSLLRPTEAGMVLKTGVSSHEFGKVADELLTAKLKVWMMAEGAMMEGVAEEFAGPRP